MLRLKELQTALLPLIGWQPDYTDPELAIAEELTVSESGLYFQQVHPLLTLQNMSSIAPDFKNTNFSNYDSTKVYNTNDIVSYNDIKYRALKPSEAMQPDVEPEYWESINLFSEWLKSKTIASIQKAISRFINEKIVNGTSKALCENRTLFDNTGRIADTVKNKHNLVGFEIIPVRSRGITVKINKIALQFTMPGEYTLYLMHSSRLEPVRIIKLKKTKVNSTEWFNIDDLYLPYLSKDTDAGGSWYLCYLQSEIPKDSMAIKKDKDWSKGPCKACSSKEYMSWQAWSKYIEVHPFFVNEEFVDATVFNSDFSNDFKKSGISLWDIEKNQYTYDNNYGLNLEVTVNCDITDFIIEQKHLFQDVIAKQVAVDMLREFAYNANVRTNRHSVNASRIDILYELDGDSSSMKESGLNYQLDMAFKAIKLNTSGLDRICMPCKNNGVKYRNI